MQLWWMFARLFFFDISSMEFVYVCALASVISDAKINFAISDTLMHWFWFFSIQRSHFFAFLCRITQRVCKVQIRDRRVTSAHDSHRIGPFIYDFFHHLVIHPRFHNLFKLIDDLQPMASFTIIPGHVYSHVNDSDKFNDMNVQKHQVHWIRLLGSCVAIVNRAKKKRLRFFSEAWSKFHALSTAGSACVLVAMDKQWNSIRNINYTEFHVKFPNHVRLMKVEWLMCQICRWVYNNKIIYPK